MRFSQVLLCLLLSGAYLLSAQRSFSQSISPAEQSENILVVYPEEAISRGQADNLSAIAQVLFAMRYQADWLEAAEAKDAVKNYNKVIWCATVDSERMPEEILTGYDGFLLVLGQAKGLDAIGIHPIPELSGKLIGTTKYRFADNYSFEASVEVLDAGIFQEASYTNQELNVYGEAFPLVSGSDRIRYIPLVDYTSNFAKALLMQEIAHWLWVWDSPIHSYSEYIVLDAVYPFTDPYRLKDIVNYMVGLKMNFVISVMPIYEHADYPAMALFCEVLRFAQANGGAVILHSPIIQDNVDPELLTKQLNTAAGNYFDNGVWLLGLEIPSEWIFDKALTDVLNRSRTLFLSELDAFERHPVNEYGLNTYLELGNQQIVPAFRLDESGISHIANCPTAVYLNLDTMTDDFIYAVVDAAKDSPIPMQDMWSMEHSIYMDDSKSLLWDRNTLTVNGEQQFINYEPHEIEENFDYKRNVYYRFVTNLARQNRFLIAVSSVVLVLFIFLVFQSRRQMRKRFLKDIPNETKEIASR